MIVFSNKFLWKLIQIYSIFIVTATFLQASHYVLYFNQDFRLSFIWSLVDWNIWFLIFLTLFYFKYQNLFFVEKSNKAHVFLILICLFFPLLHVVFSKLFFLIIFEPSHSFIEDVIRQFSKKWFQNIFITAGLYFLSDYLFQSHAPWRENEKDVDGTSTFKLLVTDGKSKYQLAPTEIEWVASSKNYVVINILDGEQIIARKTITSIYDILKEFEFIRISRSTVVNKEHVRAIKKRTKYSYSVITKSNENFAIGKTYLKKTLMLFKP